MDPVSIMLIAGGAMGAAQGGMAFYGATQSNKSRARYMRDVWEAERNRQSIQLRQAVTRAEVQKEINVKRAQQVISTIRAATGDTLGAGSGAAYQRQALFDAATNERNIDLELTGNVASIMSSGTIFEDQMQDPLLAAITAGIQGFGQGVSLAGSMGKGGGTPKK